jgi:glutamate 5-kinase
MNGATGAIEGLTAARRIVVKIGSILLADDTTGEIRGEWLDALCADLAMLRTGGADVIVVSSGAIAVGRNRLGLSRATLRLEEKQAAAAAGQIRLAHAWQEALARFDMTVAQVLLTFADTEERRRHLNARSTIETLLRLGAIPVINENDTVATDEIRFGDNDRLAARVAQMTSADLLVLLSDIDGLYSADPRRDAAAQFFSDVAEITPEIESMAGKAAPGYSSGGMITKLEAAKIAQASGCAMIIADGKPKHPLKRVAEGARCTWFGTTAEPRTARKRWIAGSVSAPGSIIIDDGAVSALGGGKSLLPAGVVAVEGEFQRGDTVTVRDIRGRRLGRGLVAYAAADARRILGHKSREIEALLGYRGRDEMIHRDDLVLD